VCRLVSSGATNRTFLEVGPSDIVQYAAPVAQWRSVYFVANCRSKSDLELAVNKSALFLPNVFAVEYDPHLVPQIDLKEWNAILHAIGYRTLTATPTQLDPSVAEQEGLYAQGIDIVYTYGTENGVAARTAVDKQRGVEPPERQ
jgi:hypothetical protein